MTTIKLIFLYKCIINCLQIFFVLLKKQISGYPRFIGNFEKSFIKYINARYGVVYANGTTALEAILFSLNLKKNDEIIVPSQTFFSTVTPILHTKAKIKFVDIDYDNLNISIANLNKKINKKTKAVIIVHLYGMPVDMQEIMKLKNKYKFYLIEDCSHAHGAKYMNKSVGTFGDASFFSFQGNKPIAAGEAGIAITNRRDIFEILQSYGHFGRYSGKYINKKLKMIEFTGFGKKSRPNSLGIILAKNDLRFLNFYNSYCEKNRKKLLPLLKENKILRTTLKKDKSEMGGFYRGFPIYIRKNYLDKITDEVFENFVVRLRSINIKTNYFKNISNHNEPLLKYENFLEYFFENKELAPKPNHDLNNTNNLQNKLCFIDLQQNLSFIKIFKFRQELKKLDLILKN